jgi:membrane-bound ClpP family serine protease
MNKRQLALLCFLTDLGLSIWSYFKLSNYDEYTKYVQEAKPYLDATKSPLASPDFQIQLYQVLLQSLTFTLFLFLAFHLVVYYLYSRGKKWAEKYIRLYTFLAAISGLLMLATGMWIGIFPLVIYAFIFVQIKKA